MSEQETERGYTIELLRPFTPEQLADAYYDVIRERLDQKRQGDHA